MAESAERYFKDPSVANRALSNGNPKGEEIHERVIRDLEREIDGKSKEIIVLTSGAKVLEESISYKIRHAIMWFPNGIRRTVGN